MDQVEELLVMVDKQLILFPLLVTHQVIQEQVAAVAAAVVEKSEQVLVVLAALAAVADQITLILAEMAVLVVLQDKVQ
jgi:hypothetical protein